METSPKKNQRVEKDAVRFGVEVTIKFGFDFKNFGNFLEPLDNFNVSSAIIEFI